MSNVGLGRTTLIPKRLKVIAVAAVIAVGGPAFIGSSGAPALAATTSTTTLYVWHPDYASSLLTAINKSRAKYGRAPLKYSSEIDRAAHYHNMWMARANLFTHQVPGELSLGARVSKYDNTWTVLEENIGVATQQSVSAVLAVNAMMMAEGPPPPGKTNHWSNLMDRRTKVAGIDVEWDGYHHKLWITEDFADS